MARKLREYSDEEARPLLATMLRVVCKLEDDEAEQAADDLVEWRNSTVLDRIDLERLAQLYKAGRFRAWDCPTCDERVYEGKPADWGHFQGVRQVDYTSYPLDSRSQCDHCRCHCPEDGLDEDDP